MCANLPTALQCIQDNTRLAEGEEREGVNPRGIETLLKLEIHSGNAGGALFTIGPDFSVHCYSTSANIQSRKADY